MDWLITLYEHDGSVTWPVANFAHDAGVSEEIARHVLHQLQLTKVAEVEWQNDSRGIAEHSRNFIAKLSNRRMVREAHRRAEIHENKIKAGRAGASRRWQNRDSKNSTLLNPSLNPSPSLKKHRNASYKSAPQPSDEAIRLAQLLSDLIADNIPNRTPPTEAEMTNWAKTADLIYRLDGHQWQAIEDLLRWSQHDSFWKSVILSMGKFRKQWNQLAAQAERSGGEHGQDQRDTPPEPKGLASLREWRKFRSERE
jgi:hypothetical protein